MAFPLGSCFLAQGFFWARGFFWAQAGLLRNFWQERSRRADLAPESRNLAVIKTGKGGWWAFPKQVRVGTYRSHPGALPGVTFRKPPERFDRRPRALAASVSETGFSEGEAKVYRGVEQPGSSSGS